MNPVYQKRLKHVEIKYRAAEMCHVDSENQSADMYTKSLSAPKLVARNLGEKRKSSKVAFELITRLNVCKDEEGFFIGVIA